MADMTLKTLIQIAKGLAAEFGSGCEVVVHDLTGGNIENSIVHIENGSVTDRTVGGGPSKAVLEALQKSPEDLEDRCAYLMQTGNGRVVKSTTLYIRDEEGKPVYVFSVNFDITNLTAMSSALHAIIDTPAEEADGQEEPARIVTDVNSLLDELLEQSVKLVGVPVPFMTKEDKIRAIRYLNDAGAFLITKSGDRVSKFFGISKYTLYSYVDINK